MLHGKIINVFRNKTEAGDAIGLSPTTITKYCTKNLKCGEYDLEFREIDEDIFNALVIHNDEGQYKTLKSNVCNNWTNQEIEYIKIMYKKITVQEISDNLNRSIKSVRGKMRRMKLKPYKKDYSEIYWTENDCKLLIEKYNTEDDIVKYFPNRSKESIHAKALKLGLIPSRIWTEEMDEIIKKYYPIERSNVYKRLPGKSKQACMQRARKLNIGAYDWNDLKIALLIKLCANNTNYKVIAKELGISVHSLMPKIEELGLKKLDPYTSNYLYVYYDKSRNAWRTKLPNKLTNKQFDDEINAAIYCKEQCEKNNIEYPIYKNIEEIIERR